MGPKRHRRRSATASRGRQVRGTGVRGPRWASSQVYPVKCRRRNGLRARAEAAPTWNKPDFRRSVAGSSCDDRRRGCSGPRRRPLVVPLAETIGQAAAGGGSSRLPVRWLSERADSTCCLVDGRGRYPACEASACSVGRVAEGVPPEQATANSGPGQDVGYHLPDLAQRRTRGCRRCRHRDPGR